MHYSDRLHRQLKNTEIKVPCAATLVLNEEAQVLLLKSADKPAWILPWGEMAATETPQATAIRVTREETGLELLDIECVGFSSANLTNRVHNGAGQPQHLHLFTFVSTYYTGSLVHPDSLSDMQFFNISDLPETASPFQESMQQFRKWLSGRSFQFS